MDSIARMMVKILGSETVPTDNDIIRKIRQTHPDSRFTRRTLAFYKSQYRVGAIAGLNGYRYTINQPDTGRRSGNKCPSLEHMLAVLEMRSDEKGSQVLFFIDYIGDKRRGTVIDRVKRRLSWACCSPSMPGAVGVRATHRKLWSGIKSVLIQEEMDYTLCVPSKNSALKVEEQALIAFINIRQAAASDPTVLRLACSKLGGFASVLSDTEVNANLIYLMEQRVVRNMISEII